MQLNKSFVSRVTALVGGAEKTNVSLFAVCKYAINKAFSGEKEYAQYLMDTLPVSYRREVSTFMRRCSINVVAQDAKSSGKRDQYLVGGVLDPKKQATIQARLNEWEAVHTGKTPRPEDFTGDVLHFEERSYKAPAKKVFSPEKADIEKRARDAVTALIGQLKKREDTEAAAVLNYLWATKSEFTAAEMCLITPESTDDDGNTTHRAVVQLNAEEWNAVMSLVQELRK